MNKEYSDPAKGSNTDIKNIVLLISSTATFFMAFMTSGLNVALPSISLEFHADALLLSWIVNAFLLAGAVFTLPFGRIADICGIKKIFLWGMAIYTLTSVIAAFSISPIMLLICRSIQGIGSAMFIGNAMAMVTATFPAKERGKALGINIACVYSGSTLGPFLGGVLTDTLGWRGIFWINVPAGLFIIALLLSRIKGEWCESKGDKFDLRGSIVYGLSLIAMMYGLTTLPEWQGAVLIAIGIIGLLAFWMLENRTASPLLNFAIFKNNRTFLFSNIAAFINYSSVFSVAFLLSLYLQYIKGLSPMLAGLVLITQPAIRAMLTPFTGRLSDKVEPRIVASIGMALCCTGLLSLAFINESTSIAQIIGSQLVLGIGFALFSSPNANAIMSSASSKFYGVASAVMNTMRSTGNTFSMGVTMIVMGMIIGKTVITPEYYSSFLTSTQVTFAIFAVLCFLGIFASLSRGNIRKG